MSLPAAVLAALLLAAVVPAAEWLRPTARTAERRGPIDLEQQVPRSFGPWREDRSVRPLLPDPQLQATLDATYTQVLARTYIDDRGRRVMLSIAYGNDQSSDATAVHRPEFCYRSQGFEIEAAGVHALSLGAHRLTVQRLVARVGPRVEPISYWITLDDQATLPGLGRKLQQLQFGLRGWIADGMVVRISSLGVPDEAAWALHEQFAAQWREAASANWRLRYFGRDAAP